MAKHFENGKGSHIIIFIYNVTTPLNFNVTTLLNFNVTILLNLVTQELSLI